MIDMSRSDNFKFFVPANIEKGKDKDGNVEMIMQGIASTSDKDRQGEMLMPQGFDYSYLQKSGYINWHHQLAKDPSSIIGEPIDVKLTRDGLYIKGKLYRDSPMAQKAYELAQTLEKNSSSRRLGWSIEGKVVERDPSNPARVLKSKITGVALTPMPINPNTYADIVKSMEYGMGGGESPALPEDGDEANGGQQYVLEEKFKSGDYVKITKGGEIILKLDKALSTVSGAPIMPEHVEGDVRIDESEKKRDNKLMEDATKELMSKAEAYEYLFTKHPDLTPEQAIKVMARAGQNEDK